MLVDNSLVHRGPSGDDVRYGMLTVVREYAAERLAASGEEPEVRRRHADWCLAFAAEARTHYYTAQEPEWLARVQADVPNLGEGFRWLLAEDDAEHALRLAADLTWYWSSVDAVAEGRDWLHRALERAPNVDPELRADAQTGEILLAFTQADLEGGEAALWDALAIWRRLGNTAGIVRAQNFGALIAVGKNDLAWATEANEEAVALAREAGDPVWIACSLGSLAHGLWLDGQLELAAAAADEAMALHRSVGYGRGLGWAVEVAGNVAMELGDYERAEGLLTEALSLSLMYDGRPGWVHAFSRMAAVVSAGGHDSRAASLLGMAANARTRIGAPETQDFGGRYGETIARVRAALGEEAFVAAWEAGGKLLLSEAIDFLMGSHRLLEPEPSPESLLTPREQEILPLLAAGLSDRAIADALFVGERTVESHVRRIFAKLGVRNRAAATSAALAAGLVDPNAVHTDG